MDEIKLKEEFLTKLKMTKSNNIMLKTKQGEKFAFTMLDLIKSGDGRFYSVAKPPIDFPNAKANSVVVFAVKYDRNECPYLVLEADRDTRCNVFSTYNERKKLHETAF